MSVFVVRFGCVIVFTGVAGRGRPLFVYEDPKVMGGWCVEQLSLTLAGS